MNAELEEILNRFLEALFFESWLRYNFLENAVKDGEEIVTLQIPESAWRQIRREYQRLTTLAATLDGKPVRIETTRRALLDCLAALLAKHNLPEENADLILNAPMLAEELDFLHSWLNLPQLALPQLEFAAWLEMFQKWKGKQTAYKSEASARIC